MSSNANTIVSVKSVASSIRGLLVNDIHSTVSFVDLLFYFYWSWGSQRLWLHQYFYLLRCLSVRSQNQFISVLQSVQSSEWNGPHKDVIQWPHQNIDILDGPHSSGTFLVTVKFLLLMFASRMHYMHKITKYFTFRWINIL